MTRKVSYLLAVLAVAGWTTTTRANDKDQKKDGKCCAEIQKSMSQLSYDLGDAVRSAERETHGKACCAQVVTWQCCQKELGDKGKRVMSPDGKEISPDHPVIKVGCFVNGHKTDVFVCGKSGKVMDKRECDGSSNHARMTSYNESNDKDRNSNVAVSADDNWNKSPTRWQKASDVIGKNLTDSSNNKIGEVKQLVVDPDASRMLYAVVEFNDKNMNRNGKRWYAMPISATHLTSDYKSVNLDYNVAQIDVNTGFEPKRWPDMANEQWASNTYKTYGQTAYWETRRSDASDSNDANREKGDKLNNAVNREGKEPPKRWQKASDLIGKSVVNQENTKLGKLDEIVYDPDSGRILYGVLSFGGFLGMGDKLFAIPWNALELSHDCKNFVLALPKDRLKNAEGFDKNNWPNMADERWATKMHDFYGKPRYWEENRGSN